MIPIEVYRTIYDALIQYRGDSAPRARAAFRGMTPEQMQQQHGQSGRTRAEVLAGYEEHERAVDVARAWLGKQSIEPTTKG